MTESMSQADDSEPRAARRTGITQLDVFNAANAITSAGLPVTALRIREQLGHTGSLTTISKYLSQWKGARRGAPGAGGRLTDDASASDAMGQFLKTALESARKEIRAMAMAEAEEQARQRWEAEFAELEAIRSKLDAREAEMQRQYAQREAMLDAGMKQNAVYMDRLPALIAETVSRQVAAEVKRIFSAAIGAEAEQISSELRRVDVSHTNLREHVEKLHRHALETLGAVSDVQDKQAKQLDDSADAMREAHAEIIDRLRRLDTARVQLEQRTKKVVRSNRVREPRHTSRIR